MQSYGARYVETQYPSMDLTALSFSCNGKKKVGDPAVCVRYNMEITASSMDATVTSLSS